MKNEWHPYKPDGDDYVPMERWGKDHWTTLLYLETCAVDTGGMISNPKMRCNPRLHRAFAHGYPHDPQSREYPTRLKGGEERYGHDDWSCLEDMVAAGLVTAEWRQPFTAPVFGGGCARVRLTERGQAIAAALRQHRAAGRPTAEFAPNLEGQS